MSDYRFVRIRGKVVKIKINKNFQDKKEISHIKNTDKAAGGLLGAALFMKVKRAVPMLGASIGLTVYGAIKRKKAYGNDLNSLVNSAEKGNSNSSKAFWARAGLATFGAAGLKIARHKGVFRKVGDQVNSARDMGFKLKNKLKPLKKSSNLSSFKGKTFKSSARKIEKLKGLISYDK